MKEKEVCPQQCSVCKRLHYRLGHSVNQSPHRTQPSEQHGLLSLEQQKAEGFAVDAKKGETYEEKVRFSIKKH